jgi:hypothetical protein
MTPLQEAGAKPGDTVECVKVRDQSLMGIRYYPGRKYAVHDWFSRPAIHGASHGQTCGAGEERWTIPFEGMGAEWRVVRS